MIATKAAQFRPNGLTVHLLHAITTLILISGSTELSICPSIYASEPDNRRVPNIVLILADDLGYGDVGCYGARKLNTPNIDRLASEGRRFTDAHSASAVCTPSRYALLTGEYPFRKNLWRPVMNPNPLVIEPSRMTIASLLKREGYATACFGKWHLGFGSQPKPDWNADLKPGPLELGFDHFLGIPVVNSHPPFVWVEDHRVVGLDPSDQLICQVDLLATFAALTGSQLTGADGPDSFNILPALIGTPEKPIRDHPEVAQRLAARLADIQKQSATR